jgi:hypothetical protein
LLDNVVPSKKFFSFPPKDDKHRSLQFFLRYGDTKDETGKWQHVWLTKSDYFEESMNHPLSQLEAITDFLVKIAKIHVQKAVDATIRKPMSSQARIDIINSISISEIMKEELRKILAGCSIMLFIDVQIYSVS